MKNIPDDILIAIATQLKRNKSATPDILAFIKVSQRWYTLGLPLLYGNISVTTSVLERFAASFIPSKYGRFVRSLSLRIGSFQSLVDKRPFWPHGDWNSWNFDLESIDGTASGQVESMPASEGLLTNNGDQRLVNRKAERRIAHLIQLFESFIPILKHLRKLTSFSLIIERHASWCSLPRATIAGLLDALPSACTDLELDTNGTDQHKEDDQTHVCDSLRRLLPRMRNVRVRLGVMCSALFEARQPQLSELESEEPSTGLPAFRPITLPHIRSLVINCGVPGDGELLPRCGYEGRRRRNIGAESWSAITSTLTDLVTQYATSLSSANIYVISPTWGQAVDLALETQLRTDMVNRETWAFPCIPEGVLPDSSSCFLIRSPDGSELAVRDMSYVDDITEGHLWRDVVGGARLHADALKAEQKGLPTFATGCVEQPIPNTMEEWLKVYPGVPKSRTFYSEQKTGSKLVNAERRTGNDFLALRPVVETTPEGWIRIGPDQELIRA